MSSYGSRDGEFEALLDRVAEELSRRLGAAGVPVLPGRCATCATPAACATVCAPEALAVYEAGAARIEGAAGMGSAERIIAGIIDHTALKPEITRSEIELLCAEAIKYGFFSVCINPFWIPLAKALLRGHGVKVCTVVGFPLGAMTAESKAAEARQAVEAGADEVDMVINVGALKSGMIDVVEADIRAVREATRGRILKVILETSKLTDPEKVEGCLASKRAEADFVKTSTGFGGGGATAADIALMRRVVGNTMGVKASGGVRSQKDAALMMASGATRIGASASVAICQELPGQGAVSGSAGGY